MEGMEGMGWEEEERLCQEIVDECLDQGVWVTRAKRLRGQEWFEDGESARACVKVCVSAGVGRRECERAAGVIRGAVGKVLRGRR